MIPQGSNLTFLKDTNVHPLKSPNTQLAAAIITCGGDFAEGNAYTNTIGENPDRTPRRVVVWMFQEKEISFLVPGPLVDIVADGVPKKAQILTEEKISTSEFIKRWNNEAWLNANADHPICYIRTYQRRLEKYRDDIRLSSPLMEIKRGGRTAYINLDDPKEKNESLLQLLGK